MFVAIARFPEVPTEREAEFRAWFAWSNDQLRDIDGLEGRRLLRAPDGSYTALVEHKSAETFAAMRTTGAASHVHALLAELFGELGYAVTHEEMEVGINAIAAPIVVGLVLGYQAVAGMLMVGTISGVLLATVLNNGGGAWDNAKKYIESGHLKDDEGNVLGKGSDAHAAAVVGDTVGDPFKDTAGPSLHVLVKLLATITLVLAPLFIR